jgi:arylsulfatase A-like enzyme
MQRSSGIWGSLAMLLAAVAACPGCGEARAPGARRIVVVSFDTTRADHIGCYGSAGAHTPAIDALAAAGVRFENAIAPAPITLVSHASLMTGLEPHRHGVRHNGIFRLSTDVPTLAGHMQEAGFSTAAFVGAVVLDRQYGLDSGFDVYDDRMGRAGEVGDEERPADQVVDAALRWLESAPEAFFMWVHLFDPHSAYDPPAGFAIAFPNDPYRGEIAFADSQLARLIEAVEAKFPDGRTVFAMTSDHGESLGEHGEFSHSMTLYDATQRVPLVLRGPDLPAGRSVSSPVGLVDLAPTLLALVGASPLEDVDGRDLRELIEAEDPERAVYVETVAPQTDFGWSPLLGLRTARHKYIRAPRPELYDLAEDPAETRDLAARPDMQALREALDARLTQRLEGARTAGTRIDVTDESRAQLEALGYVAGGGTWEGPEIGVVGGADPKDGLPLVQAVLQAVILIAEDRPRQALGLLEGESGSSYLLDLFRSRAAHGAGEPELAEQYARSALAHSPASVEAHVALARALELREHWPQARALYEGAIRLDEAAADALVGMGRIAEAHGRLDEAAQWYERGARQRGDGSEAQWRLAALRIERGEDASALLAQLPAAALARPDPAIRLARAERAAGDRQAALRRLRRAHRANPSAKLRAALEAEREAP